MVRAVGIDVVRYYSKNSLSSVRTRDLVYVETRTGNYYVPRDAYEDIIAKAIKAGEVYGEAIVSEASRFILPGDTVLDVGSNFGQMAVLFGKKVGKGGRVYAFEADEFVYSILKRT